MTPKQKYDERKRLRTERLLRDEQRAKDARDRDDDVEERMTRLLVAFERIADVMELWADLQEHGTRP
ncbi:MULTISPECIES: hypothetical protein [Brucella]|uniref:hypothetical protein n=1 Tax=Brucella TaxID=234 RepID=UPI00141830C7|nr:MULTISPECIES: hypothetical protein [Brucella]KAB2679772.1 hypothetical protein F9K78_19295 [Brucella pseudintermedia]MCO7728796.1 hypothetical protein [Brucella intermedia]